MSEVMRSAEGVRLTNLNWGYQVVHGNLVLVAIHDTQGGPHRTPECKAKAEAIWADARTIYYVLYSKGLPVTYPMLNALQSLIRNWAIGKIHLNTLHALRRRGVLDWNWNLTIETPALDAFHKEKK